MTPTQATDAQAFYRSIVHDLNNNLGAIHLIAAALEKSMPVVIRTSQAVLSSGSNTCCSESVLKELHKVLDDYNAARQKVYEILTNAREYLAQPEAEMQISFKSAFAEVNTHIDIIRAAVKFLSSHQAAMREGYETALQQNLLAISKDDKLQMSHFENSIETVASAIANMDAVLARTK